MYEVIDHVNSELDRRFSNDNAVIIHGIQALNPASSSFLDISAVSSFTKFYNLRVTDIEAE